LATLKAICRHREVPETEPEPAEALTGEIAPVS